MNFIGITEFFSQSLCILTYKLKRFKFFDRHCICPSFPHTSDVSTHSVQNGLNASTLLNSSSFPVKFHNRGGQLKGLGAPKDWRRALGLFNFSYEDIEEMNSWLTLDEQLYSHNVQRFFKELREVETASNRTLGCLDRPSSRARS